MGMGQKSDMWTLIFYQNSSFSLQLSSFIESSKNSFQMFLYKKVKCVPLIYWTLFFWAFTFPIYPNWSEKRIRKTNKQTTNKTKQQEQEQQQQWKSQKLESTGGTIVLKRRPLFLKWRLIISSGKKVRSLGNMCFCS